jgi:outer membrane protein assembly factor BamB
VSATPTVANNVVYFPDFGGYLNAVNAKTGELIWQHKISEYDGSPGVVSRVSPAIYKKELILGDNASAAQPGGAHVFAVDRATGALIWSKQVDSHPAAIDTSNPEIVGNKVIVGVASNEEADATAHNYPCCSFRGSVVALNAQTGSMLWKTYTIPPTAGHAKRPNQPKAAATAAARSGERPRWIPPRTPCSSGPVITTRLPMKRKNARKKLSRTKPRTPAARRQTTTSTACLR